MINESVSSSFNYKELELEEKHSLSSFEVSDINAFYKDSDDIFNKNITYDDNKVNINIDYDYTAYNFDNAYLINTCFDGHVFVSDDKYYYIELMGDFSCQYASSIDINIITNFYRKVLTISSENNIVNINKTRTPKKLTTYNAIARRKMQKHCCAGHRQFHTIIPKIIQYKSVVSS